MGRFVWPATGLVGLLLLLSGLAVVVHTPASREWKRFVLAPATGNSVSVQRTSIHADGITLRTMISVAYSISPVRIIGSRLLDNARYTLHAEVSPDAEDLFRRLLQEELKSRLRLEAHFEDHSYDAFVLTATAVPRLEKASGTESSTWIRERDVRITDGGLDRLAGALQSIIGKPVVDETGIRGLYNFEFAWGEDRLATVSEVMRNRFGLRLAPGNRTLDALVIDHLNPEVALSVISQVGRLTSGVPRGIRYRIADMLTIH
jgi:uncharacterized protein (TIGR03435 family)